MALAVSNNFRIVCNAIRHQNGSQQRQCGELVELLKCLNSTEKLLIAKYFCQLPHNIGTMRLLYQLQQLRILTATEYILSIQNEVQLQVMLSEFLEAEYGLLTNLFVSAAYDPLNTIKLSSTLEDALRRLFTDLKENPKISNLTYLESLCRSLPGDVLTKVIHTHVNILLDLHVSNINQAFEHFSAWINEGVDDLTFIKVVCEKLLAQHGNEALKYLFKLSISEDFKHWKFYLILVQSIASSSTAETVKFIKQYLKKRLLQIANEPCERSVLHLLLTARAAAATTIDLQRNLDAYASWYKQNIGEMAYLMDIEKFQVILHLLQDSIPYEMEQQYLEIHVAITISPPALCGKMVQCYKSKCKAHLSQLKRKTYTEEN